MVRELARRAYEHPDGRQRQYTRGTFDRWNRAYREQANAAPVHPAANITPNSLSSPLDIYGGEYLINRSARRALNARCVQWSPAAADASDTTYSGTLN
jgi:hypothetical protein